jgi:hypothetical protein
MKKFLVIVLCLFTLSCSKTSDQPGNSNSGAQSSSPTTAQPTSTPSGDAITFSIVQPVGQKSLYDMKTTFKVDAENPPPGQPAGSVVNMGMNLETDVIESNPDGTWTVKSKISNVKMDMSVDGRTMPTPPGATGGVEGQTYTVTYDKNGKVVKFDGAAGNQSSENMKEMLEQINPTDMLPPGPVRVGDSWPITLKMPMPASAGPAQSFDTSGTGRLTGVNNGQATLEYDLKMNINGPVNGTGTGKSTMLYDLQKSRMITSVMDMNVDLSGQQGNQTMKARMNMKMTYDLINK